MIGFLLVVDDVVASALVRAWVRFVCFFVPSSFSFEMELYLLILGRGRVAILCARVCMCGRVTILRVCACVRVCVCVAELPYCVCVHVGACVYVWRSGHTACVYVCVCACVCVCSGVTTRAFWPHQWAVTVRIKKKYIKKTKRHFNEQWAVLVGERGPGWW